MLRASGIGEGRLTDPPSPAPLPPAPPPAGPPVPPPATVDAPPPTPAASWFALASAPSEQPSVASIATRAAMCSRQRVAGMGPSWTGSSEGFSNRRARSAAPGRPRRVRRRPAIEQGQSSAAEHLLLNGGSASVHVHGDVR